MQRAIVFVGGELCDISRLKITPHDFIIGVDSGAAHALHYGLIPNIAIGDFDSIPAETKAELMRRGVPLKTFPVDKDYTDLELALEHCLQLSVNEIVLTCALGGRLDMILGNVLMLARPEYSKIKCSIVDGDTIGIITGAISACPARLEILTTPGDTISLIPLTPTVEGVTITGTQWLLNDHTLTFGSAGTLSNRAVETAVSVSHRAGIMLVIHTIK